MKGDRENIRNHTNDRSLVKRKLIPITQRSFNVCKISFCDCGSCGKDVLFDTVKPPYKVLALLSEQSGIRELGVKVAKLKAGTCDCLLRHKLAWNVSG